MSSDTDDHQLFVEGETLQTEHQVAVGQQLSPASEDDGEPQQLQLQKKAEDDKLLTDAGFPLEGLTEKERKETLDAVKNSLAAADPLQTAESHADDSVNSIVSSKPFKTRVSRKKQQAESTDSESESERMGAADIRESNADDGVNSIVSMKPFKTRTSRKKQLADTDSETESERLGAAGITEFHVDEGVNSIVSTHLLKTRTSRKKRMADTESERPGATGIKSTRLSRRQQTKVVDVRSEANDNDTDSAEEKSEDIDGICDDLLTRSVKKMATKQQETMKLSLRQKKLSQSRFKDLFNKTNLPQHLSPVKEGLEVSEKVQQSSQDLFPNQQSDEEARSDLQRTHTSGAQVEGSTSNLNSPAAKGASQLNTSPDNSQTSDISCKFPSIQIQWQDSCVKGMQVDDLETQPPEQCHVSQEEKDENVTKLEEEEEEKEVSYVIRLEEAKKEIANVTRLEKEEEQITNVIRLEEEEEKDVANVIRLEKEEEQITNVIRLEEEEEKDVANVIRLEEEEEKDVANVTRLEEEEEQQVTNVTSLVEEEKEVADITRVEEQEKEVANVTSSDQTKEEHEEGTASPVYRVDMTSVHRCGKDQHSRGISPSMLPIEDEEDKRPLLHDNWFSWPHVPPVFHLERSYRTSIRKRKEPPAKATLSFRPPSVSPVQHSRQISQMFDAHFLGFTGMQRCFRKLSWGKPVRSGHHVPHSLDALQRGGHVYCWDTEEDHFSDFEDGPPPAKKIFTRGGQRTRGVCLSRKEMSSAKTRGCAEGKGNAVTSAGETAAVQAGYEVELADSDDDLPDIQLSSVSSVPLEGNRAHSRGADKKVTVSPPPASQGSQSSNSLLNEQGELYSTQVPHRKRRPNTRVQDMLPAGQRPKRLCKTISLSHHGVEHEDDDSSSEPPRLTRTNLKRKQASPYNFQKQIHVLNKLKDMDDDDDDDDNDNEVSSPRSKKINVGVSSNYFVHISSTANKHDVLTHSIVHPTPQRARDSGKEHGLLLPGRIAPALGGSLSAALKTIRPNPVGKESDDSVQFVDTSSLPQTAKKPKTVSALQLQSAQIRDDLGAAVSHLQQPVPRTADEEVEETMECPLCSKHFPLSVIQRHASDCTGEEEANAQQPPSDLTTASELKRRPLHGEIKSDDFACVLCQVKLGGSSALVRHYEKCRLQCEKEDTQSSAKEAAASTSATDQQWLSSYKIPRKDKRQGGNFQSTSKGETDEDIQEVNSDLDKEPDFVVSKDDERQEQEDMEGEDNSPEDEDPLGSNIPPIDVLQDNLEDFQNKIARKTRQRPSKQKDK